MPRWSKLCRSLLPGEHNSLFMQLISVTVLQYEEIHSSYLHTSHWTVTKNGNMVGIYLFILTKFIGQIFLLCNMKVNFCVHTSKPFFPLLSHYKPVHFFTSYFSKVQYNIFVSSDFLPKRFRTNIFMHFSLFTGKKLFIISLCTLPKYLDNQVGYTFFLLNVLLHSILN